MAQNDSAREHSASCVMNKFKLSYGVSLGQSSGQPLGKSLAKAFRKDRLVDAGFPHGACLYSDSLS